MACWSARMTGCFWDGSNEVHRYYTEPDYFTDKDVQDWVDLLTARRDRIEALGATYRHMTVPDKLSLLPDMAGVPLPNFDRHPASLIAARLPGDGLNIDILSDLREAGKEAPVFYRTDSHWNSFGCQVAYRRLCAILGATPRDFSDRKSGGKLMSMDLGQKLAPPLQEEARFTIVKRDAQRVSENEPVRYNEQTGFREGKPRFVGCHVHLRNDSPDARPETLLLFGDLQRVPSASADGHAGRNLSRCAFRLVRQSGFRPDRAAPSADRHLTDRRTLHAHPAHGRVPGLARLSGPA